MTADNTQSLREDIAFMKSLADEGMSTPLVGGPILMMFGAVFTITNLVSWVAAHYVKLSGDHMFWFSLAAGAICVVGLPLLILRTRKQAGAKAPANRAFGMVWAGIGNAIGVMTLITYIACRMAGSGQPAMLMGPAVIVLYAVGWTVAAAMTRQRFLWITAAASYFAAFVPLLAWNSPNANLWVALVIFLIAFMPGTVLFLREPKTTV